MSYTNNVPQGNQQIATTQPLIQANFGFLENSVGQEHNFDVTDATKTYHLQASMPNQSDPVALPSGTNGMYYVNGGEPKFYDGSTASNIAIGDVAFLVPFNGSLLINVGQKANVTPTITGNVAGIISLQRNDGNFATWAFIKGSSYSRNVEQIGDTDAGHLTVLWDGSNLAIKNDGSSNYTFKYSGFYYPML